MIVTHTIKSDLITPDSRPQKLDMMQHDSGSRAVAVALTAGGEAFVPPVGTAAVVRFCRPDGTGGVYSTLPNGSDACAINGSTVTAVMAPQVLSSPGAVAVSICLTCGEAVLGSFAFTLCVHPNPAADAGNAESYFGYETLAEINTALAAALAGVEAVDDKIALAVADLYQLEALFVNSIDECTDTGKVYILPDGYIYAYLRTTTKDYVNYLALSTDENGDLYNGGQGWKENTRLNSSGEETTAAGTEVTGFIPITIGDLLRFENIKITGVEGDGNTTQYIVFYDSNKTKIKHAYTHNVYETSNQAGYLTLDNSGYWSLYNTANLKALDTGVDWSDLAYFRISAEEITAESLIAINDEGVENDPVTAWQSTGHAFVPADYEDRILDLEQHVTDTAGQEARLTALEENLDGVVLPDYWQSHCDEKLALINAAMENAGRNKSAFLWYTDAHWAYGSQMSPALLRYLFRHSAINKVNFGGDIVDDYAVSADACMDGLRQWRLAVRELPHHHSVLGNHDDDITELSTVKQRYGFLMAPEEEASVVRGGDFTYYIDDPNEKTRYLYLNTAMCTSLDAAGDAEAVSFAVDAIGSAPEGWHIAVISHIWFLYADTATPTVGSIPDYCQVFLDLFDALNSRSSGSVTVDGTEIPYDFTSSGAAVVFCIGGHIHVDHDLRSAGGIPVILTETDSRHLRGELTYTPGTVTEASVSAVIADYDAGTVTVIRIGRGEDRTVSL